MDSKVSMLATPGYSNQFPFPPNPPKQYYVDFLQALPRSDGKNTNLVVI